MKRSMLAAGLLCTAFAVCAQGPMRAPVVSVSDVMELERVESRKYTGTIVVPESVQVVPRVSGEIVKVGFKDGAIIKKGQLLYKLDDIRYRAVVKGIEAKIKGIEAKILSCSAKQKYAKQNYDRIFKLYEKKAESLDTLENRKASLDGANAEMLAAQAELDAAKAELITAKDDLKNTTITSPIDGVAGVNQTSIGNYITPGSGMLVKIVKVNPIRVKFAISTNDFLSGFGSLKRMQDSSSVKLRLSNGKEYPLEGKVAFLNNEANSRTDAILVYAEFKNDKQFLINGSTVTITLSKKDKAKSLAIPLSAVVYDVKGACVYVVGSDNKAKKHYIVPSGSDSEYQYVSGGLSKGQKVISAGTHKVMMDGMPVQVSNAAGK